MSTPRRIPSFLRGLAVAVLMLGVARAATTPNDAFLGRWALTIQGGAAGWLEVKKEKSWIEGSILWRGGSVLPVASVTVADGTLTVTRVRDVERKDAAGKVLLKQTFTETLTAQLEGDTLKGVQSVPRLNGTGFDKVEWTGKKIPALPARPNLAAVKFGEPIPLFDGKSLAGWTLKEPDMKSAWSVENGVLANRPPAHVAGQPNVRTANLRTEREFEDFNLKLEVSVPAGSNSGVYLRGIYEVQVFDSFGKALDSHNMGAIYSRITPSVAAEKPAGEWQTLDITLVDRHATVVLNGQTIIDNQPLAGCTGGAMWSDQFRPGPIYLQGDHGAVSYRNLTLRPVVK
ncbi:3-keto-disaccharide hydrolase [Horticoccus sp. 23ND18S-11]|uniref:3-keto-disaccharide hydrolase n=1 Tax=Horticoccus sp. 23ND18S-11 TaxID=3391832 RepID=UPI0039C8CE19